MTQKWPKGGPFGVVDGVKHKTKLTPQTEANQTVRLDLGTKDGVKSMRIGFTDQRLTAHGGLAVWSRSVTERGLREQLRAVLPHTPTSPNAYDPCDTALGFIGGILCGADKLARSRIWRTTQRWPRCSASRRSRVNRRSRVSSRSVAAVPARPSPGCTGGCWKDFRPGPRATRWIWIRFPCSTRTVIRKACGWATLARA